MPPCCWQSAAALLRGLTWR